jgi:membrane dipeptidase
MRIPALIGFAVSLPLLPPASTGAAAIDPAAARAVHDAALVFDSHLDTALNLVRPGWDIRRRHSWAEHLSQVDIPRLREAGVDGGLWVIYVGQGARTPEARAAARDRALRIAVRLREMVAANPDTFVLATRAEEAPAIAASGRHAVYLSMENGYPIGTDLTLLRTFRDLGMRVFGPVHWLNNDLADAGTDPKGPEWGGLSPLGREAVAECNRLGVVLDASHASDEVLRQMIHLSATPVLLSHSGCKAIHDHPRNIGDDLLRELARSGGVIQMNAFSRYVAAVPENLERNRAIADLRARHAGAERADPSRYEAYHSEQVELERRHPMPLATFDQFMAHVLHALRVAGVDHVGFSGDFDGGGGVEGLMDVTGMPRITERLLAEGYTEEDVRKFWGGNLLRVLRAAERHAEALAREGRP